MRKNSQERQISSSTLSRIGRLATCSQILLWVGGNFTALALTGCGSGSSASKMTSAPTLVFSASSNSIVTGQAVTLTWQTTNATSVAITATGADGTVRQISTNSQLNGSVQDKPTQTTTYAATATGTGGALGSRRSVAVNQPVPTLTFSADRTTITTGGTVNLSWQTDQCHLDHNHSYGRRRSHPADLHSDNPAPDQPTENTTYTAVATGPGGNSTPQQVDVSVTQPQPPTLVFSASSNSITKGDTVDLSWQLSNATSITITAVGADGVTRQISTAQNPAPDQPTEDTTYTAVATGPGGQYCASERLGYCCPRRAADNTIERKSHNRCCGRILNVDVGDYQRHLGGLFTCAPAGDPRRLALCQFQILLASQFQSRRRLHTQWSPLILEASKVSQPVSPLLQSI